MQEAKAPPLTNIMSLDQRPAKNFKRENDNITFTEEDARHVNFPHNDALVLTAMISNINVHKVLVDNGSAVDILYYETFLKMGLGVDKLKPITTPLYGFTGHSIMPEGSIELPLTVGEYPRQTMIITNFLVVKCPSAFYAVLGRPALKELKAVTSIYHLAIKFPTAAGTGMQRGNQGAARECYYSTMRQASKMERSTTMMVVTERLLDDTLDPRFSDGAQDTLTAERLLEVSVDEKDKSKTLKLGENLNEATRQDVTNFLKDNLDIFAWNHSDMEGIDPSIISHKLNIDPAARPKRQKRRSMDVERYQALKEEVDKLLKSGFIREAFYPNWLANPVLVKKANGKWRTCIDFTDLNKACPKDSFPLPRIDQLVDSTAGHELLSFMDAYSGYNQIPMHPPDEDHTSFITDRGLYCYKVMPFGLKNAGATY